MRNTLLIFLTVLFLAQMLSGCFYYPYRDDWGGRGYERERGYYYDRDYDRDRYYRERR